MSVSSSVMWAEKCLAASFQACARLEEEEILSDNLLSCHWVLRLYLHCLIKSSQHGLEHTRKLRLDFKRQISPKDTKLVTCRTSSANHVYIISVCALDIMPVLCQGIGQYCQIENKQTKTTTKETGHPTTSEFHINNHQYFHLSMSHVIFWAYLDQKIICCLPEI